MFDSSSFENLNRLRRGIGWAARKASGYWNGLIGPPGEDPSGQPEEARPSFSESDRKLLALARYLIEIQKKT